MNIKATKSDIIWSYVGTFFSLSASFLLLPFVMLKLSGSELGLWYVFLSINGLVSLFDFGFDPTFARNVAYVWGGATKLKKVGAEFSRDNTSPNFILLELVIKTCKLVYGIISIAAVLLVIFIGTPYINHIAAGLPANSYLVAWFIFSASLFLNLYMGYYSALLRGVGAVSLINKVTILSKLTQIVVSTILLFLGWRLVAVSVGFLANGLVLRYLCRYGFYNYRNIGRRLANVSHKFTFDEIKETLRIVSYNAFKDGVVAVANYIMTQASSIMASLFLSLSQTGVYSISLQLANAVSNVAATMINAYQPTLQSAFVNRDRDLEKKVVSKGLSMLYILAFVGTFGVIVVVFPILHVIKPSAAFSVPIFLGISVYTFLWQQQSAGAAYIANTNEVPYAKSFIVSSFLGILFTIFGFKFLHLGIWSLIICPGLVQGMFNNWFWLRKVMRRLDVRFWKLLESGFHYWVVTARGVILSVSKGR